MKTGEPAELLKAIDVVREGGSYLSPSVTNVVMDAFNAPEGEATVETYTVVYQEEEPISGFVLGRTVKDERFLARVEDDPDTLRAMTSQEVIGERGTVRQSAVQGVNLFSL